jgi:pilus assembly protein Flp/PilA
MPKKHIGRLNQTHIAADNSSVRSKTVKRRFLSALKDFIQDERGQDLIEYALIIGLIALGAVASMQSLATGFSTSLSKVGSKMATYTS